MTENCVDKETRVKPEYYDKHGVPCLKVIDAITKDYPSDIAFYVGNVIKYLYRAPNKGGASDLRKALTYMEMVVEKSV